MEESKIEIVCEDDFGSVWEGVSSSFAESNDDLDMNMFVMDELFSKDFDEQSSPSSFFAESSNADHQNSSFLNDNNTRARVEYLCESCLVPDNDSNNSKRTKNQTRYKMVYPGKDVSEKFLRVEMDICLNDTANVNVVALNKLRNGKFVRAYCEVSQKHQLEVEVYVEGETFKLALVSPGQKPSKPFFKLFRVEADVYRMFLVNSGEDEPNSLEEDLQRNLESADACLAHMVALTRAYKRTKNEQDANAMFEYVEKFGDTAYFYTLYREGEMIRVGEVVARVSTGSSLIFVTKAPDEKCKVVGWNVVANHKSMLGFDPELPQPNILSNPYGYSKNSVAVATKGVVAVRTDGGCVVGQWLRASGNKDGKAVVVDRESHDDAKKLLGKVQIGSGDCAMIEVNMSHQPLYPDPAKVKPKSTKSEMKAKARMKEGDEQKDMGNFMKAIEIYKRGEDRQDASEFTRTLLCCRVAELCLDADPQKQPSSLKEAKKYAKRATQLCPIHGDGFFLLARARLALGDPQKARQAMIPALDTNLDREDYHEFMAKIREELKSMELGVDSRLDLHPKESADIRSEPLKQRLSAAEFKENQAERMESDFEKLPIPDYFKKLMTIERLRDTQRFEEAIAYGESLVKEKHAGVLCNLAMMYMNGWPIKNLKRSSELLWIAASVKDMGAERVIGVAEAKGFLAESLIDGHHPHIAQDCLRGANLAQEGAHRGAPTAQAVLGNYLTSLNKHGEALDWYRLAAEGDGKYSGGVGSSAAMENAGKMFLFGSGVIKNSFRALGYLETAHRCGNLSVSPIIELLKKEKAKDPKRFALGKGIETELSSIPKGSRSRKWNELCKKMHVFPETPEGEFKYHDIEKHANDSLYTQSLYRAYRNWDEGCLLLSGTNDEKEKGLKLMAEADASQDFMCRQEEGLQNLVKIVCDEILRRIPKHRNALYVSSIFLAMPEKIERLRHLLILFPNDTEAMVWLGSCLCFSINFKEGRNWLDCALTVKPDDYDCLFLCAECVRLKGGDSEQLYERFLKLAPPDHRKRPSSLYHLAIINHKKNDREKCASLAKEALAAESRMLPMFLPVNTPDKDFLDIEGYLPDPSIEPPFVAGPRRAHILRRIRERSPKKSLERVQRDPAAEMYTENLVLELSNGRKQSKQQLRGDWTLLQSIVLLDFIPQNDVIHEGCKIDLTIITPPQHLSKRYWYFIVEDMNKDVEPMLIDVSEGRFNLKQGTQLCVAHPYQHLSRDERSMIRVDDKNTVKVVGHGMICSYCCKTAVKLLCCSRCKQAYYCSQQHQTLDWKLAGHKFECAPPQKERK